MPHPHYFYAPSALYSDGANSFRSSFVFCSNRSAQRRANGIASVSVEVTFLYPRILPGKVFVQELVHNLGEVFSPHERPFHMQRFRALPQRKYRSTYKPPPPSLQHFRMIVLILNTISISPTHSHACQILMAFKIFDQCDKFGERTLKGTGSDSK